MTTDAAPPTDSADGCRVVSVEVWSDVVCPWCYIGKRRFAAGLDLAREQLSAQGIEVGVDVDFAVTYHPYQLDPTATPGTSGPVVDAYAKKFGGPERARQIIDSVTATAADVGLQFAMDRALRASTLLAHRVIWLAGRPDSPVSQDAVKERFLKAYFTDGLDIGDPDVVADCAAEAGLDRATVVTFLESGGGSAEVGAELAHAHEQGITAVPTYVLAGRWAVPGAQEPETFAQVLARMAQRVLAEPA
jgi:predicted DsbA family dithiol-disulfide isomerase